jgi:UTP--glucose-1-phosphate uridylyltransferase
MTIDIAVVPVAGHGTRLLPATKSQPKEMLSVGRKPVVQYVVEELGLSGIRRLLFITSHGKASIEQHFDIDEKLTSYLRETGREEQLQDLDFERREMEYFYTRQRRQLGLGHAVLCAKSLIGKQPFVVALGDSIIGLHAKSDIVGRMIEQFEETSADLVVAFEEVPAEEVIHYGIAKPQAESGDVFELKDVIEKPAQSEAPSNLAVAARYVFSPAIFAALEETPPGKGGEIQLTDAIRLLLKQGCRGLGIRLGPGERRFDIGNFDSYFRTFAEFALRDPRYGAKLRRFVRELLDGEND